MKATQASARYAKNGQTALSQELPQKPCAVCGKTSRPYGYVNHGDGQVCSRACDETYHNARYAK